MLEREDRTLGFRVYDSVAFWKCWLSLGLCHTGTVVYAEGFPSVMASEGVTLGWPGIYLLRARNLTKAATWACSSKKNSCSLELLKMAGLVRPAIFTQSKLGLYVDVQPDIWELGHSPSVTASEADTHSDWRRLTKSWPGDQALAAHCFQIVAKFDCHT